MEKNKLGRTRYRVSKIGLGTVQFGIDYGFTKRKSQKEVDSILSCAVRNDINFIDTAREYGDSESKIGNFISRNRNEFIIATKLKKLTKDIASDDKKLKEHVYTSIEGSLSDLKLQKIDLLQLHQAEDYIVNNNSFWTAIDSLKAQGLIGAFGISVYDEKEANILVDKHHSKLDFLQIPYNIFDRRFDALEQSFSKYSVGLISRSTFLKGIIPCAMNELPRDLAKLSSYKIRLNEIAKEFSMEAEEIALMFTYYNESIASTILGVDSAQELEKNIKTLNKYKTSELKYFDTSSLAVKDLGLIDPRRWTGF